MVTLDGTVADVLLLEIFTTTPPEPAAAVSVTVPVDEAPPSRLTGFSVTEARVGAVIVKMAVFETDPNFAVIVAAVWVETPVVFTVNFAVLEPP